MASVPATGDRKVPYVVAINCFDEVLHHQVEDVRDALTVDEKVPVITCDARDRESAKESLIALVEHAVRERMSTTAG